MNTNARELLEGAVGEDRAMFDRWADLRMEHGEGFLGIDCTASFRIVYSDHNA